MKAPKYFARPDGQIFSVNDDGTTYSLRSSKKKFPGHIHNEYTLEVMVSKGFKPVKKKDFPRLKEVRKEYQQWQLWSSRSDGHGGVKGGTLEEFRNKQKQAA